MLCALRSHPEEDEGGRAKEKALNKARKMIFLPQKAKKLLQRPRGEKKVVKGENWIKIYKARDIFLLSSSHPLSLSLIIIIIAMPLNATAMSQKCCLSTLFFRVFLSSPLMPNAPNKERSGKSRHRLARLEWITNLTENLPTGREKEREGWNNEIRKLMPFESGGLMRWW